MITTILPQIAIMCSAIAATTYLIKTKRDSPMTPKDADIMWKIHKQKSTCCSTKMKPLTKKNGKITGFQCQCGFRYTQKRPLIS